MRLRRGDIILVDLGPPPGHEQAGRRPAVVVQNDIGNRFAPTTIIVPLSSRPPRLPTHVAVEHPALSLPSTALGEQIRVVNRSRILGSMGGLDGNQMLALERAVLEALGFKRVRLEALLAAPA